MGVGILDAAVREAVKRSPPFHLDARGRPNVGVAEHAAAGQYISISEGADVYGSDGEHGGRVEAVGARYLTIAAGLFGQKTFHLPLGLVARADGERVDLAVPLIDAQARAFKDIPPPDEPIYQEPRPVPVEERGAVGIPVEARGNFGLSAL